MGPRCRGGLRTRWRARGTAAAAGAAVTLMAGLAAATPAAAAPVAAQANAAAQALAPPGLFGWGSEALGELGNGVSGPALEADTPQPVRLPAGVTQISAEGNNGAAVLASGNIATWGDNAWGQLGDGTISSRSTPFVIPGLTAIVQVADGGSHMLALDSAGKVWAWGSNPSGELGLGTTSNVHGSNPAPVQVPGLSGVVQIAAGVGNSFALRSDGTVWAWGYNYWGQLGDGTTVNSDIPAQVPGLAGIKKIFAGDTDTYAVRADGSVLTWGANSTGLLGSGTAGGFSATPVPVPGLTGVTQISASRYAALAIAGSAGTLWGWGYNTEGELGDGTTTPHYSPEQLGLTGVRQVAEGSETSAAVLASGSLMTWGGNNSGQLGTGSHDSTAHTAPVPVRTLLGVSQVSAGAADVMAVGSPAPRIPSVIDETQSQAAADLQAAGFTLGRVAVVVDLTCEYIGVVKIQSPAAGTPEPPGTAVSVAIGKAGGKCL